MASYHTVCNCIELRDCATRRVWVSFELSVSSIEVGVGVDTLLHDLCRVNNFKMSFFITDSAPEHGLHNSGESRSFCVNFTRVTEATFTVSLNWNCTGVFPAVAHR